MTMVAWRSYHKHLSTEVIGISFLHQVKAVGCSTHRHTMNTGLSTKGLKTIVIEPTVNDVLTKFIVLLTKMYVHM